MSYPPFVLATLNSIGSTSCGSPSERLEYQAGSSPPEYLAMSGQTTFTYISLYQTVSGGNTTWELAVRYNTSGGCAGAWTFQRSVPADNPVGDYCIYDGSLDCNAGTAGVVNDS